VTELCECVFGLATEWWPARKIVAAALARTEASAGRLRQVLVLDQHCPWTGHLLDLEAERGVSGAGAEAVKYVLYADQKGQWRVQAVPVSAGSFTSRLPLPEPWRGVRDEALSALTGIDGCVFVHAAGFIGGHKTKEGALQLATKALEMLQT